jgi:endogenous inhibitor of DNA gyrase (YacG/DUF329 family)
MIGVTVTADCPACKAEGYEFEFTAEDLAQFAEISVPCDECGERIVVQAEVTVTSSRPTQREKR